MYQAYERGNDTQQDFAPDLDRGNLLGIVLGRCEDFSDIETWEGIDVLIVHDKGKHFERVGSMEVQCRMLTSIPYYDFGRSDKMPREIFFRLKERRTIRLG